MAWTRNFWEAIRPYSTGRVYVNFLGEEGQDRVRAAYGDAKYERCARSSGRTPRRTCRFEILSRARESQTASGRAATTRRNYILGNKPRKI